MSYNRFQLINDCFCLNAIHWLVKKCSTHKIPLFSGRYTVKWIHALWHLQSVSLATWTDHFQLHLQLLSNLQNLDPWSHTSLNGDRTQAGCLARKQTAQLFHHTRMAVTQKFRLYLSGRLSVAGWRLLGIDRQGPTNLRECHLAGDTLCNESLLRNSGLGGHRTRLGLYDHNLNLINKKKYIFAFFSKNPAPVCVFIRQILLIFVKNILNI